MGLAGVGGGEIGEPMVRGQRLAGVSPRALMHSIAATDDSIVLYTRNFWEH